jgi:hypothetical protein
MIDCPICHCLVYDPEILNKHIDWHYRQQATSHELEIQPE